MDLNEYIGEYVIKMGQDAIGTLLNVLPVALRINVQIIDLKNIKENLSRNMLVHDVH